MTWTALHCVEENVSHNSQGISQNSKCQPRYISLYTNVQSISKDPQNNTDITIDLGAPTDYDGKAWLMKSPYNLVKGNGEFKLGLIQKFSPYWLSFTMSEVAMQIAKEEVIDSLHSY